MNCAVLCILVNDTALHHKYDAANSRDVFQPIAIEGNDVGLQIRCDGANLIRHPKRFPESHVCS
jgi:hypothetical protein